MSIALKAPAIEINDLSFKRGTQTVLHHINMQLLQQEYAAIIGPNGGGKSTLIALILGILPLQRGQIKLFGVPIEAFQTHHLIGYVPQRVRQDVVDFPATVLEVMELGRIGMKKWYERYSANDYIAIDEALEQMDVMHLKNRAFTHLSGGERQRVMIARALASKPKLLILDEPDTGVDVQSQHRFYDLLRLLHKEHGVTVLLVTHDIGVVLQDLTQSYCINQTLLGCSNPASSVNCSAISELYGVASHVMHHHH